MNKLFNLFSSVLSSMLALIGLASVCASCQNEGELSDNSLAVNKNYAEVSSVIRTTSSTFYVGADLSYANELEDTGVSFTENGVTKDIYELTNSYGANMVRLRLWHNPTWTNYSTLADVKKSAKRAIAANMSILLDFHYSDTWTAPEQNLVPAAWAAVVNDTETLADSVYNY